MITALTGTLGSGKTYSMVDVCYEHYRAAWPQIYTNMRSLRFPGAIYMSSRRLEGLAEIQQGVLMLDEAHIMLDAYFWQQIPDTVLQGMTMGRKLGLDMYFTTQHISQVASRLRNLVNEEVYCRRLGPFVLMAWRVPGQKTAIRRRLRRMRPRVWRLYDTLEIIGKGRGEGVEPCQWLAALRAERAAQRHGRPQGRQEREGRGPYYRRVGRVYDKRYRLTSEARSAYDWLVEHRYLMPGYQDWARVVSEELQRRAWLAEFGLDWQRVPPYVRYDRPWAEGATPEEVEQRVTIQLRADQEAKARRMIEAKAIEKQLRDEMLRGS